MNWITNYVRPRINSIFSRREIPENLWTKCDECGTMLFHRELRENLNVCTACGHHMAITPRERFTALFDGGAFSQVTIPQPTADPLHFRDQKKYPDRLRAAQKATGETEAMLVASGEIGRTRIHGRIGTCRQRLVTLVGRGGHGDDASRAPEPSELDREVAHTTGGGMDDHGLTGTQSRRSAQQMPGGETLDEQAERRCVAQGRWHLEAHGGRDESALGVTASPGGGESAYATAVGQCADDFSAGDEGELLSREVGVLNCVGVGVIDPGS